MAGTGTIAARRSSALMASAPVIPESVIKQPLILQFVRVLNGMEPIPEQDQQLKHIKAEPQWTLQYLIRKLLKSDGLIPSTKHEKHHKKSVKKHEKHSKHKRKNSTHSASHTASPKEYSLAGSRELSRLAITEENETQVEQDKDGLIMNPLDNKLDDPLNDEKHMDLTPPDAKIIPDESAFLSESTVGDGDVVVTPPVDPLAIIDMFGSAPLIRISRHHQTQDIFLDWNDSTITLGSLQQQYGFGVNPTHPRMPAKRHCMTLMSHGYLIYTPQPTYMK